jgi:hypothetical protein
MDMRFGIWNVRNMCKLGALKRVVGELAGHVRFNGMQEVIWNKGATEPADYYIFFYSVLN